MARLLYVEASPRKQRSASIEVSLAFLDAYRAAHPGDEIETMDVWALDLPAFDGDALAAKYAGLSGDALTAGQARAWEGIRRLAAAFHAADKLLFAVPLWNFGIPYKLKHLIDVISQKDVLFSFDANGFGGLLGARRPPSSTRAAWITFPHPRSRRRQAMIFSDPISPCGCASSVSPISARSWSKRPCSGRKSIPTAGLRRSGRRRRWRGASDGVGRSRRCPDSGSVNAA